MTSKDVTELLNAVGCWAPTRSDIACVLVVGSHARGDAAADSDIDFMLLSEDPGGFLEDRSWIETFGAVESCEIEDWGAVTSLRVRYDSGLEVEFGVAHVSWTSVDPLDPGTLRVVGDGWRILFDRHGLLERLRDHLEA